MQNAKWLPKAPQGSTPLERADAYRTWLKQGTSDDELIAIRQHLHQERALGSKRFQAMAERTTGTPGHWARGI
jgi:putative transposase